jgi:DNA-binding phage protein
MLTVDQIKIILSDRNLSKVAIESEVSAASIYRLLKEDSKPLYETVKKLSDYLEVSK